MAQIQFLKMFQMLEETEEALPPIGMGINQSIVRQVQVASTGHSGESQAEINPKCEWGEMLDCPQNCGSLPVYVRNVISIQWNHCNALVWEGITI